MRSPCAIEYLDCAERFGGSGGWSKRGSDDATCAIYEQCLLTNYQYIFARLLLPPRLPCAIAVSACVVLASGHWASESCAIVGGREATATHAHVVCRLRRGGRHGRGGARAAVQAPPPMLQLPPIAHPNPSRCTNPLADGTIAELESAAVADPMLASLASASSSRSRSRPPRRRPSDEWRAFERATNGDRPSSADRRAPTPIR